MKICSVGVACSKRKDQCISKLLTLSFRWSWLKRSSSLNASSGRCFSYAKPQTDVRPSRISLDLQDPKFITVQANIPALDFASCDPEHLSPATCKVANLVGGVWTYDPASHCIIVDPLTGKPMMSVADVKPHETAPFVAALRACPKYGLHNPLRRVERYRTYGDVCAAAAAALGEPAVARFFARLIQRVSPKSYQQAVGEVTVTRAFLHNFSGDQVRFLARSFGTPGDHLGQSTQGYRWPYGPVAIITPFNFPLEIPALQLLGALFMGNKPLLKVDQKVSVVMEQFLRLLLRCGMPPDDAALMHCSGAVAHSLLLEARPRNTVFTGSSRVADILARDLHGRIKVEGAGFDWKIVGPMQHELRSAAAAAAAAAAGEGTAACEEEEAAAAAAAEEAAAHGGPRAPAPPVSPQRSGKGGGRTAAESLMDYVAYVCDQDAHACSGQKCSAQSMLVVHESWRPHLEPRLRTLAGRRRLQDLTVGPLLSVTSETFLGHMRDVLKIPGARLLWGGQELEGGGHGVPACYGAVEPTAVEVPLKEILRSRESFALATREIFGPFQVVTYFGNGELEGVLELVERMDEHLTAAVVSNDPVFQHRILSRSVNGTTYTGIRARTTGAPQNHWFGPAGDPRAAGIGTAEAIQGNWSCHREIIRDMWPIQQGWVAPPQS